jgi:hypothetical protein
MTPVPSAFVFVAECPICGVKLRVDGPDGIIPHVRAAHPGSDLDDVIELALVTREEWAAS